VLGGEVPWHRYTREGFFHGSGAKENTYATYAKTERANSDSAPEQYSLVAPFEVSFIAMAQQSGAAAGPCGGGGADAAYRLSPQWQIAFQVAGCKMSGLAENLSGDSLTYLAGPRWTPSPADRWSPYVQVLAGGQKLTYETFDPAAKAAITQAYKETGQTPGDSEHALYTSDSASNKFAFKVGAGVDLKLNSAFAFRVVGVDYLYSTMHHTGFQVATSLVLRFGTW
jgi:opacity protein-like surface antigen